jgi:hypothetical protein
MRKHNRHGNKKKIVFQHIWDLIFIYEPFYKGIFVVRQFNLNYFGPIFNHMFGKQTNPLGI